MASTASRGPGVYPPPNFPYLNNGNSYVFGNGPIQLAAGEAFPLPPGQFYVQVGPYTMLQEYDPVLGKYRGFGNSVGRPVYVSSDGGNYRLVNLTGCAIGALVTNVGSGYTSLPTVSPGAGSSVWLPILGGAINATVAITTAGSYAYPPMLVFGPPPPGGVQATGYVTLSAGAINAVTVVDQGAGYLSAPAAYLIPDPRETLAGGGVLTVNATLVGAGTITALLCTNHGTPVTAVPTLTISGGGGSSGAATAIMCFTATGIGSVTGGSTYGNAQPFQVSTYGGAVNPAGAGATVNPAISTGLLVPRMANIIGTSTSGGAITATGLQVVDGGLFNAVPQNTINGQGTGGVATVTVGGVNDTSFIFVA